MARIIVTGGSGFLGKHLIRALLAHGHLVTNIDLKPHPNFPTLQLNVLDKEAMFSHLREADAVFHLASLIEAGESVREPAKYLEWNVLGTINVLEAMRQNGIHHFLFSSSAAIYGDPLRTPIQEDDRTLPVNPYGMTKLAMEGLLSSYVKSFGMTGTALRYFNLYGPGEDHQPETHAIPRFIDQLKNNQALTVYGNGSHVRDFIFIDDVVKAHLVALEFSFAHPGQYHYFNISTGVGETVAGVIERLAKIMNLEPKIDNLPERPGDPQTLLADPTKAKNILNWQAQVSLEEGLQKTVISRIAPSQL